MDQVTKVINKFRLEQWIKLIKDCQSSGMKVDDWCNANGVTHHTYYYWLRKVREAACHELAIVDDSPNEPVVLKKLKVQTPVPGTTAAIIIRLGGATIEVNEGTSQQTNQAVLLALQSVC